MADETIGIRITTRGARQSAQETRRVAGAIGTLAPAARRARSSIGSLGSGMGALARQAKVVGAGVLGLAALTARAGIQFDAFQEQSQIAFTGLLGSSKAARKELVFLQQTAAKTPFELPQITTGARQLLAFGFNVKQANSLLGTMGDAAAGAGLGADAIDQMVRAFGQIRGKGTLQAEELNQLGELGLVNREKLAKNLHITTAQLADAGNQGIGANKAIGALQKTLDDTFGGASAKQAQTFNGQMSTLHDTFNQTAGIIAKPAFDKLRRDVLPALTDTAKAIGRISGRHDLDIASKLDLSERVIKRKLGPFARELGVAVSQAHIPERIGAAIQAGAPMIGRAFGHAAPVAARSFWDAFKSSGPAGQAAIIGILGAKFGGFKALGGAIGGLLGKGIGGKITGRAGAVPVWVVNQGGMPGGPGKGKGPGKIARLGKKLLPGAAGLTLGDAGVAGGALLAPAAAAYGLGNYGPTKGTAHGINRLTGRPYTQGTDKVGPRGVGGIGPVTRPARINPSPMAPIVVHLKVDGKTLAQTTLHAANNARAARKGF
jgi:tape measure domain-containing protein